MNDWPNWKWCGAWKPTRNGQRSKTATFTEGRCKPRNSCVSSKSHKPVAFDFCCSLTKLIMNTSLPKNLRNPNFDPPMTNTPASFIRPPSSPWSEFQMCSKSWTGVRSHTSLRLVLILRCRSSRLKSMTETERNVSVSLWGTYADTAALPRCHLPPAGLTEVY